MPIASRATRIFGTSRCRRWRPRACGRAGRRPCCRCRGRAAGRRPARRAGRASRAASCGSAAGGRSRTPRCRSRAPASVASRSSSEERAGCRISTISWSPISLRAHWMIADADAQQRQAEGDAEGDVLGAPRPPMRVVVVEREVGDHEQHGADHRRRKKAATWRSARFSFAGSTSVGRQVCSGRPGLAIGSSLGDRRQVVVVRVAHASTPVAWLLRSCGSCGRRSTRRTRRTGRCRSARRTGPRDGPRPPRPKPP